MTIIRDDIYYNGSEVIRMWNSPRHSPTSIYHYNEPLHLPSFTTVYLWSIRELNHIFAMWRATKQTNAWSKGPEDKLAKIVQVVMVAMNTSLPVSPTLCSPLATCCYLKRTPYYNELHQLQELPMCSKLPSRCRHENYFNPFYCTSNRYIDHHGDFN